MDAPEVGEYKIEILDGDLPLDELHLEEKEFSTGSTGYFASCKVSFDGKEYQATINIVEIGSKEE